MKHDIEDYWSSYALGHWTGRGLSVDDSSQIPSILVSTDQLVVDIARSTGDQFRVQKDRQGREIVKATELAQRILDWAQRDDVATVSRHLNRHSLSPRFELLNACRDELGLVSFGVPPLALVQQANQWVDSLRVQARAKPLKDAVDSRERGPRKNEKRTRQYVRALLRRFSTLLVLQLELGYHHDPRCVGPNGPHFSDAEVHAQLKQVRNFVRGKLPGVVGLIWRLEFSAVRGHYFHLMVFFDGDLAFDRTASGGLVAEQWSSLTRAYGTCWNWAIEPSRQRHASGIVSVLDEDACRRLVQEAMFFARLDYYACLESPTFKRTFGKGEITDKLVLRERPRKATKLRITRAMASV